MTFTSLSLGMLSVGLSMLLIGWTLDTLRRGNHWGVDHSRLGWSAKDSWDSGPRRPITLADFAREPRRPRS
ncbi:hypothetical protein ACYOEI_39730 [Singulisphaera rosea]